MPDFHNELIVKRWLWKHFISGNLKKIKALLENGSLPLFEEDGQTGFYHLLSSNDINHNLLSEETFKRYDLNIASYWKEITKRRNAQEGAVLSMKYFQYLSLLFSEIYLDNFFNHKEELINMLNEELETYLNEPDSKNLSPFIDRDLNKVAFWSATGSGKTLLLHVNIKQYLYYFQKKYPHKNPDKIILLTPNEGLSKQHLDELHLSGFINTKIFNKNHSNPFPGTIEILEITKLSDEMGEKTVSVEAFEGNNLVLVDEGHRGSSSQSGQWLRRRDILCREGFSFEYSATFGQVVSDRKTVKDLENKKIKDNAKLYFPTRSFKALTPDELSEIALTDEEKEICRLTAGFEVYAKSIIFDYSYKYFYEDGYGKESVILNQSTALDDQRNKIFFTACLLSFYQQLYLWDKHKEAISEFKIEKPLWVFVGNSVSAEDSDIITVLELFANIINDRSQLLLWIKSLLNNEPLLIDDNNTNVFHNRFAPLADINPNDLLSDLYKKVFNSESSQQIKVVNIKNAKGELSLQLGENDPFGLINVGDDSQVYKNVESNPLFSTHDREFGEGLFGTINQKNSKLNILIGSRKFTEGWSSWRVSTMGLLNMGTGAGSQIIQLFGRGVRLKGKGFSLKRSLATERPKGVYLEKLESLNIFGVRANYMDKFREYFTEDGINLEKDMLPIIEIPTKIHFPDKKLKMLELKKGFKDYEENGFKRTQFPLLFNVPLEYKGRINKLHVKLDLYPKIQALVTDSKNVESNNEGKLQGFIKNEIMAFFDFDRIYLELLSLKSQKNYVNLRIEKQDLINFCLSENSWYTLFIPEMELKITHFSDVKKQEEILLRLLSIYMDRFYKSMKTAYEGNHFTTIDLKKDHESFLKIYNIEIENTVDGRALKEQIEILKLFIEEDNRYKAEDWHQDYITSICFDKHLFYPLLSVDSGNNLPIKIIPKSLDAESEVKFINELEAFLENKDRYDFLKQKNVYLLRNADNQHKGLGFAMAGNFYPDFLLWVIDEKSEKQWLSFIDPKGIFKLDSSNPKFKLHSEVKDIEKKLSDKNLNLSAFILSITNYGALLQTGTQEEKSDFEERNVLFMEDGKDVYLEKMFKKILDVSL